MYYLKLKKPQMCTWSRNTYSQKPTYTVCITHRGRHRQTIDMGKKNQKNCLWTRKGWFEEREGSMPAVTWLPRNAMEMSHVVQCSMFQCNAMEMYCNENVVHIQCIAICKFDIVQCLTKCTVLDWSEMFLLCKVQISNDSEVPGNAGGKPCYLPFLSITVSSLPGGSSGREGEKEIIFSSSSDHV